MKLVILLSLLVALTVGNRINFNFDVNSIVRRSASSLFGSRSNANSNSNNNNGKIHFDDGDIVGKGPTISPQNAAIFAEKSDEMFRKKLCAGERSTDFLYHRKTGKCYQIGGRGPCGDNMAFYKEAGSPVYGECDCAMDEVPLVYYPKTDKCYFVYQQAYCQAGFWLAFNRRGEAVCERNKCLKSGSKRGSWTTNTKPDIVPFRGTGDCVQLFTRGGDRCPADEVITFLPRQVWSRCGSLNFGIKHISPVGPLPCPPGSYPSITGRCSPAIDWDF